MKWNIEAAMFKKILIANRGAIASRILRTLKQNGISSVVVYSEADAMAPYVQNADEAVEIGPAHPKESYLNQQAIENAIISTGADGVHPGYGFLAENPEFCERIIKTGATLLVLLHGGLRQWVIRLRHGSL